MHNKLVDVNFYRLNLEQFCIAIESSEPVCNASIAGDLPLLSTSIEIETLPFAQFFYLLSRARNPRLTPAPRGRVIDEQTLRSQIEN